MNEKSWSNLDYYQDELVYLRRMGAQFARLHPHAAGRLELGGDECADPQVERLIESFAFLTARIRRDLDNEFPELATALLGVLYPHLVSPVPSVTIARFQVDPAQGKLTGGYTVEKGTELFAPVADETGQAAAPLDRPLCRFRTCYPVTLWPVEVEWAGLEGAERYGAGERVPEARAVLRLRLRSLQGTFPEMECRRLRFYLNGETTGHASRLYQLIFQHVRRVGILPPNGAAPVLLPAADTLLPVGFGPDEEVLPYPAHGHPAYRLLQEYFVARRKFFFFDVNHLDSSWGGETLDLLFFLDRAPGETVRLDARNFVLGCTPVVNLFTRVTEPIRLDGSQSEYRLVVDARNEGTTEIHSVLEVEAVDREGGGAEPLEPFYSVRHQLQPREHVCYWYARRTPALARDRRGTDLHLSFVDPSFRAAMPDARVAFARALCTNRRLAEQVPERGLLHMEVPAPVKQVVALHAPTRASDPVMGGAALWRLVSHLSLGHLSLAERDAEHSLRALQEMLRLYAAFGSETVETRIGGIQAMKCRPVMRRLGPDAWRGFCRGTEITLTFGEEAFAGTSPFLLAAVLNRCFARYVSVNSFTELAVRMGNGEEVWKRWPAMTGERVLL